MMGFILQNNKYRGGRTVAARGPASSTRTAMIRHTTKISGRGRAIQQDLEEAAPLEAAVGLNEGGGSNSYIEEFLKNLLLRAEDPLPQFANLIEDLGVG